MPVSGLLKRWVWVCDLEAKGRPQGTALKSGLWSGCSWVNDTDARVPAQVPVLAPPLFLTGRRQAALP